MSIKFETDRMRNHNESSIDVSIVMTYFERKSQLINTIKSFSMHEYEGVEVIIIDDGSIKQPISSQEISCYAPKLEIRVIRMEPDQKKYNNPCIPFNKGFAEVRGKIVIIQNAECIHVDDIVSYCRRFLDDEKYFSFGCFSIDQNAMLEICSQETLNKPFLQKYISENKCVKTDGENGWYNHSVFRPVAYHFTAAMTRSNLDLLKGFDPRYAKGIGFDDDELVERIRRSRMAINIIDGIQVLHQWHYAFAKNKSFDKLFARNRLLLRLVTKKERDISYSKYSIRYMLFLISSPVLLRFVKLLDRRRTKCLNYKVK